MMMMNATALLQVTVGVRPNMYRNNSKNFVVSNRLIIRSMTLFGSKRSNCDNINKDTLKMCTRLKWIDIFMRQCLVTSGVSMNLMNHGLVLGFTAVLVIQIRDEIPVYYYSQSWIFSIVAAAMVLGALILPCIMNTLGHRTANFISVTAMLLGWLCFTSATNLITIILARSLHGFSMGLSTSLCSVLIGEYTSPKNRGGFLTTISLAIACGTLISHALGSYFHWQQIALICATITFGNLMVVMFSPESPSFLVSKGRYDECRKSFHWLRGCDEEEELEKMIKNNVINKDKEEDVQRKYEYKFKYYKKVFQKKEFYKPLILVMHLYMIGQWSGANILQAFRSEIFHNIVGYGIDLYPIFVSTDALRIYYNLYAIILFWYFGRRTMLISTTSINILSFVTIGTYSYLKSHGLLPYDHPFIGIYLIYVHMFSIVAGSAPLPYIIAGEVFPLEYKGIAGMISVLFLVSNLLVNVKSMIFLYINLGLHGTYWLHAGIVSYCLMVVWVMLPETKDRTLLDIEEEFRGRPEQGEAASQSINSVIHEDSKN